MHKYLTLILLPSMLLLASCGLLDEYLDSSETPENSQEIEEPVFQDSVIIDDKKIIRKKWLLGFAKEIKNLKKKKKNVIIVS